MINPRDLEVLSLFRGLKQVTSGQVRELIFPENASKTACDRSLKRLREQDLLRQIERDAPGGYKGGSGQFVYQLGYRGWVFLGKQGRYRINPIRHHDVAVSTVYTSVIRAGRSGLLRVVNMETEPDTHVTIGEVELRPDLQLEAQLAGASSTSLIWIEVDLFSEGRKQIEAMLHRYVSAYRYSGEYEMIDNRTGERRYEVRGLARFPRVMFLARYQTRIDQLKYYVSQLPIDVQPLFAVENLDSFPQVLTI